MHAQSKEGKFNSTSKLVHYMLRAQPPGLVVAHSSRVLALRVSLEKPLHPSANVVCNFTSKVMPSGSEAGRQLMKDSF